MPIVSVTGCSYRFDKQEHDRGEQRSTILTHCVCAGAADLQYLRTSSVSDDPENPTVLFLLSYSHIILVVLKVGSGTT